MTSSYRSADGDQRGQKWTTRSLQWEIGAIISCQGVGPDGVVQTPFRRSIKHQNSTAHAHSPTMGCQTYGLMRLVRGRPHKIIDSMNNGARCGAPSNKKLRRERPINTHDIAQECPRAASAGLSTSTEHRLTSHCSRPLVVCSLQPQCFNVRLSPSEQKDMFQRTAQISSMQSAQITIFRGALVTGLELRWATREGHTCQNPIGHRSRP